MKKTKTKKDTHIGEKPTPADLYEVMREVCSVPNPWAFCPRWATEKPRVFNKFMEMCAWFKNDIYFILQKVTCVEFMYHKGLKQDVLISPDHPEGFIVFFDPVTHQWVKSERKNFASPKDKH